MFGLLLGLSILMPKSAGNNNGQSKSPNLFFLLLLTPAATFVYTPFMLKMRTIASFP